MFIALSQLINQAGLSRLNLSLQPSGNGRVSVLISCVANQGDAPTPKLRQALASELSVEGTVSELEQAFVNHLTAFTDSFVEADLIATTATATEQHSQTTADVATSVKPSGQSVKDDLISAVADAPANAVNETKTDWE